MGYLIFAILSTSFYYKYFEGRIYTIIKVLCLSLLLINEIIKYKMTFKTWMGLSVCSIIYVIIAYNTGLFSDVVLLLAFVYCGRNICFEKIAKVTAYASFALLFLVILSASAGVIINYIEIVEGRYREYLGFRYALYPAAIAFNITALVIYIKREHIKLLDVILLGITNIFIFYKTNSRLSFYMSIMVILLMIFFQRFPNILQHSKVLHAGMSISFIVASIGTAWLTVKYKESVEWMKTLNQIFNNLLNLGNRSLMLYGVSLFGKHNMEWVGNGLDSMGKKSTQAYLWVDNFYISIMQRFGIFVTVIIILLLTLTLIKCIKLKNYYIMLMLTFMAGHCMIDDLFLYLHYNTFWFVIGAIFIESNSFHKIRKSSLKYTITGKNMVLRD